VTRPELVAMGASAGGVDALKEILSRLPPDLPFSLLLVPHRARDTSDGLLHLLKGSTSGLVLEPEDKEPILPGRIYLAPADYHLLVDGRSFALSTEELVHYARPSIDVTFESAAQAYRERMVGIILSGAGKDGASGLARVKAMGGLTAAQDPETALVRAMPDAAIALAEPHRILPLEEIGEFILTVYIAGVEPGADLPQRRSKT
jgi:two-component system, chemotaxis family, protein-glutamate methylesterase/glutaminase